MNEATRTAEGGFFPRLFRALTPPNLRDVDEEQRRRIETILIFTFSGLAIFAAFAFMVFRQGNYAAARTHLTVVSTYLVGIAVLRGGYPVPAMYLNIAATAGGIFGAMWFGGGLGAPAVVFVGTLPVVGFLSLGKRAGIYGAFTGLVIVVAIVALEALGHEPRHDPPRVLYAKRIIETVVIVIEMYVLSLAFQNLTDRAYGLLSNKRDEVASLLNSMRQGVLAFGPDGRVVGDHSQQAQAIFGRDKLAGVPVIELLYGDAPAYDVERELFESWLENVFAVGRRGWDDLSPMAPDARVLHRGLPNEQHLRIEVRPVFGGDALSRVMLLVTDESEQVRLQREVDQSKAEKQRSLDKMRRLAATGAHTFVAYLASSRARIAELRAVVAQRPAQLRRGQIEYFFRQAHTVRGEAKAFDLAALEKPMEGVEHLLRGLLQRAFTERCDPPLGSVADELERLLTESARAVEEAQAGLVEVSPIGDAILDQVTVSRRELDALTASVASLRKLGASLDGITVLEQVSARLSSRPFGELAGHYTDAVQRWAEQCGKSVRLEIEGKGTPISPALSDVLPRALAHLLRNAVAHGIETPQRREDLGKSPTGLVRISCLEVDGEVRIVVEDDGSGLDVEALRKRAAELGVPEREPEELIFADGISTSERVDSLSGHGVGMGAVREALSEIGYSIEVCSEAQRGARFEMKQSRRSATVLIASGA